MHRRDVLRTGGMFLGGLALEGCRVNEAGARQQDAEKALVERLGFKPDARLLMIHADDLGMSHSVNAASEKALTEGVASSASCMVPCPWFPAIAAWSRENPDADLGLHLTLTSEWQLYRWRPVAHPDQVKGLMDPDGFLWRSVAEVKAHAKPAEVETEIRAQVARARHFGMKPTHVDSHMGTLFADPQFFAAYVRVAKETGIMPMLPGPTPAIIEEARQLGMDYPPLVRKLKGEGYVFLDVLNTSIQGATYEERQEAFHQFVRGLTPGVTELIVHLAGDDQEIQHITNNWRNRYNEFRLLTAPETRAFLREQHVTLVGYRQLSKLWKP